jgi:hypothetical protein
MSQLSKLNLLGLINLSEIVCELRLNYDFDKAMTRVKECIEEIKDLNSIDNAGVASQNIMEEYLESLTQIKERLLDFPIDKDGNP